MRESNKTKAKIYDLTIRLRVICPADEIAITGDLLEEVIEQMLEVETATLSGPVSVEITQVKH